MRILLVEDDRFITELLTETLLSENYVVDVAADGEEGWDFVQAFEYDLLILDVMMPKLTGVELCHRIRKEGYKMPVLMLTALDTTQDQVEGLNAGADDYIVKPYKLQELLARIRALLRRGKASMPPIMTWGDLSLDANTREVSYGANSIKLTPKEYRILELFLRHGNRVLSRNTIIEKLWSFDEPPEEDAVKAHIKRLRQKLRGAGASSDFIETVYGVGYRLKELSLSKA